MFHVEGRTPEAPDLETATGGNSVETLAITQSDLDELQKALPSGRILDQYNELKQDSDPGMPCVVEAECPCWTPDELDSIDGYDNNGMPIGLFCPPPPPGIPADAEAHFNLTVHRLDGGNSPAVVEQEIYPEVSIDADDPNFVGDALHHSALVRLRDTGATQRPRPTVGPGALMNPDYVYADGTRLPAEMLTDYDLIGSPRDSTGLYALEQIARLDLLCIVPPAAGFSLGPVARFAAERYCRRRQAVLLVEPPGHWQLARDVIADGQRDEFASPNVVTCFPLPGDSSVLGALAGALAAHDQASGAWSLPTGPLRLRFPWRPHLELSPADVSALIRAGVNPLTAAGPGRIDLHGGVTTARGSGLAPEWCALRWRRTALFAVSGIVHNSRWMLFRRDAATCIADLRTQLEAFLSALQASGALAGIRAKEGWFLHEPRIRDEHLEIEFGIALRRPGEFLHFRVVQSGSDADVRELGWQPALAAAI